MDGFTFYKSYYETLKKIRKRADRAETALSVLEFMFEGCEPENLSEGGEIAFESFRRTLEISRVRGKSGETQKEIKSKSKQNQMETNESKIETNEIKAETSSSSRLSSSLIDPPISPLTRVEDSAKTAFFDAYPALKGKRVKDDGVDYTVLMQEFEKSATLRRMFSFAKVVELYGSIKNGDFRDKATPQTEAVAAANARAARDKWYAERQAAAEAVAYKHQQTAKRNARYCQLEKELARLTLELAKAEVAGADLTELKEYQAALQAERGNVLKKIGLTEAQLVPQYSCQKCKDSGYLASGKACDCYTAKEDML